MDKHAVIADRVVNIDETSCRLLVHQIGWSRPGVKQAQATTFTVAFSMDRGAVDVLVQIVHTGNTDAVLPEQPWQDHTPLPDIAARDRSGRRDEPRQGRTIVDPSLGHGEHPRQRRYPCRHEGDVSSRRAVLHPSKKHVVLAAFRRGRLLQLQELHPAASERHSCPLRFRRLVRPHRDEKGMATTVSRNHGPLGRERGLEHPMSSIARTQRHRFPRGR